MGINKLSAIGCEICQDAENGILGSFPNRSSVRFSVSVTFNILVPHEDGVWLSLFLQLPCGSSAGPEVRCEIALIFGFDDNQVGVQMRQDALHVRSDVGVVLGNDEIVPLGDNIRGELGNRCRDNRLEDVMNTNDVRLDLPHVWLNCRV